MTQPFLPSHIVGSGSWEKLQAADIKVEGLRLLKLSKCESFMVNLQLIWQGSELARTRLFFH
jgi:hypothetical protein